MNMLTEFIPWWLSIYGGLLGIYFVACLIISRLNDSAPGRARRVRTDVQPPQRPLRQQIHAAMVSLAGISLLLAAGCVLNRAGLALFPGVQLAWKLDIAAFLLSMVLYDASFYWIHRLLHRPVWFKSIHYFHHQVTAPAPWTTNSELVIDGMLINSYWLLAPLVLPIPLSVLLCHRAFDLVMGVLGHSGHEYGGILIAPPSPLVSVTHHDQHHQYFHCNYAVHFTLWDRLLGTLHPAHDQALLKR